MPIASAFRRQVAVFVSWISVEHRLAAASLVRIGFGSIMSILYALHVGQRQFLWGPNGQLDFAAYAASTQPTPLTLFAVSASPAWHEFLFWFSLAVAIVYTLGVWSRIVGILFYATTFSMLDRANINMDGGQNLLVIVLAYLMFANVNAYFAVRLRLPALRSLAPLGAVIRKLVVEPLRPYAAIVHNAAILLVLGQLALLYFFSGFYKITGTKWQHGTALYYVTRVEEFTLPGISRYFYENQYFVAAMNYATLVFLIGTPFLMWFRRTKVFCFAFALLFHLGIAVLMGLPWFSLTMITADIIMLPDDLILAAVSAFTRAGKMAASQLRVPRLQPARQLAD